MIPPSHSGEFVACMEDVLELYEQPYTSESPVVCMDEAILTLGGTLTPDQEERFEDVLTARAHWNSPEGEAELERMLLDAMKRHAGEDPPGPSTPGLPPMQDFPDDPVASIERPDRPGRNDPSGAEAVGSTRSATCARTRPS